MKIIVKRSIIFVIITMQLLTFTGCEYRDLENIKITAGVTLDGEEGDLQSSLEFVYAGNGTDVKLEPDVIEVSGKSILDIVNMSDLSTSKVLFWNHVQVIGISQQLAEGGVRWLCDELLQHDEFRISTNMVVVKDADVSDMLALKAGDIGISSFYVRRNIEETSKISYIPSGGFFKFYRHLVEKGKCAFLPCIKIEEGEEGNTCIPYGSAVFSDDKLNGFIDINETLLVMCVEGDVNKGIRTINLPDGKCNILISKSSAKKDVKHKDGEDIALSMTLDLDVRLMEASEGIDLSKNEQRQRIKTLAEEQIKSDLIALYERAANELKADVLGFSCKLASKDKEYWESISDIWEKEMISKLSPEISVNINVKEYGSIVLTK